jgi:hypothetical protein
MDTIKDQQRLETMDESGDAPWRLTGLRPSERDPV